MVGAIGFYCKPSLWRWELDLKLEKCLFRYYNYYNLYGDGTLEPSSGYNSAALRIELEMSSREF